MNIQICRFSYKWFPNPLAKTTIVWHIYAERRRNQLWYCEILNKIKRGRKIITLCYVGRAYFSVLQWCMCWLHSGKQWPKCIIAVIRVDVKIAGTSQLWKERMVWGNKLNQIIIGQKGCKNYFRKSIINQQSSWCINSLKGLPWWLRWQKTWL